MEDNLHVDVCLPYLKAGTIARKIFQLYVHRATPAGDIIRVEVKYDIVLIRNIDQRLPNGRYSKIMKIV